MSRYRKTFKKKIIQKTNRSYEGIEDSKIRLPKLLAHSKKLNDIESYIKISQRIQKTMQPENPTALEDNLFDLLDKLYIVNKYTE